MPIPGVNFNGHLQGNNSSFVNQTAYNGTDSYGPGNYSTLRPGFYNQTDDLFDSRNSTTPTPGLGNQTTDNASGVEVWILIIIGISSLAFLILCLIVVYCIVKRRTHRRSGVTDDNEDEDVALDQIVE